MNLTINPIKEDELSVLMLEEAAKEGWLYSSYDVDCYFNYPLNRIYAINVDDELAGCVLLHESLSRVQGRPLRSAGFFLVKEKYRGQRVVGPLLWQNAITASISREMLVCFHAVPRAVNFYERLGFLRTSLVNIFYSLQLKQINKAQLATIIPLIENGVLKRIVSFQEIDGYTETLFNGASGAGFFDFIHHWVSRPDAIILAYYEQGVVKGYGVLTVCKQSRKKDENSLCYRVSPLYADSIEIADSLLKALIYYTWQNKVDRIELNSLASLGTAFAHKLADLGFIASGMNYVVANHSHLIDSKAAILDKIFTSLPLEYPHEVTGGFD
ncbi:GNAT family N-acetyltransferase [Legionella sp. 29fVS95]|uniref:GNAT family N-acetyltransferase n=1 Tax=Legionella sp. 29fVS95 TaxID=3402813 RepID=UPI003AF48EB2